jgi:phage repressor protein C with HTH and peptisase S24 domain
VHRWTTGAEPRGNFRDAIVALYDRLFREQLPVEHTVKLAGFVGAGQEVYQFDEDGAGEVEAPPGAGAETLAVEVRGTSMLPLFQDGTLLYYSKQLSPELMIGKQCVVRLEDDRVLVKTLRRGSERWLWTLVSLNAPDIEDVAVQWAAPIDWIKPR